MLRYRRDDLETEIASVRAAITTMEKQINGHASAEHASCVSP
ncbi:MAG: hypothetical protein AB8A46_02440 [Prochlorococcus sp.]